MYPFEKRPRPTHVPTIFYEFSRHIRHIDIDLSRSDDKVTKEIK